MKEILDLVNKRLDKIEILKKENIESYADNMENFIGNPTLKYLEGREYELLIMYRILFNKINSKDN